MDKQVFLIIWILLHLGINSNKLLADEINNKVENNKYKNIVIDGSDDEWKNIRNIYERGDVEAACIMDDRYLYIHLYTKDKLYKMQIINFGLIIDVKINNEKNGFKIEYPTVQYMPPPPPEIGNAMPDEKRKNEMNRTLIMRNKYLTIIKRDHSSKKILIENDADIQGCIKDDPNRLVYEVRIPARMICNDFEKKKSIKYVSVILKNPDIDYKKLTKRFGVPKEDKNNGRRPPENSQFKPSELIIKSMNIKMDCIL
jgi:hypothetical protein